MQTICELVIAWVFSLLLNVGAVLQCNGSTSLSSDCLFDARRNLYANT